MARARSHSTGGEGLSVYKRLLGYARPHWRLFAVASVAMIGYAAADAGFAAVMEPLIDGGFVDHDPAVIRWVPPALIGLFLVRGLSGFSSSYLMYWIGRQVVKALRRDMFAHLLRLPTRYYDNTSSGQLLSKLTYDVEQVGQASTSAVRVLVQDSLTVVALLAWMFYISPFLSAVFVVAGPVLALLVAYVSQRLRRASGNIQSTLGDLTQSAEEAIDGHRVVKSFGGEAQQSRVFAHANEANRRHHMKLVAAGSAIVPLGQFVAACALALIVFLATLPTVREAITAGRFMSFMTAMLLLMPPLKRLTSVNTNLQKGIAGADSLFAVIDAEPERDTGTRRLERARGDVEYADVTFGYGDGEPVLQEVSFRARAGETVAIVGRSGSGKSTLVNLLPRFYEPQSGVVRLDDGDVRDYRLGDLRDQIALVSQDITLFNDTIAGNIAYGLLEDTPREAVIEAAETAGVMAFARELPAGIDTVVGENGVLLSGGQRQRVAIARALLKHAPLLILDEATSSLDSETERSIQSAFDTLARQTTVLVIAHRLSTVQRADQILVMDGGRIIERGRHAELVAQQGHYAALYQMQFREGTAASAG